MYAYITGKVTDVGVNFIILENNNIGYYIFVSDSSLYKIEKEYKLFLYYYIKENLQVFYGFDDNKSLEFFKKILSVPSIGPKSALILSDKNTLKQVIKAIETHDYLYLKKFPGIGIKIAQQIIFKLKGKLVILEKNIFCDKQKKLEKILLNLGFSRKEINDVILEINFQSDLEVIVKKALTLLSKQ